MLVENISMIWLTTESGIWPPSTLASVAAYSEVVMSRERISTRRSSSAGALLATNLSPLRVTVTVLNWSLSSGSSRAATAAGRFVGFGLDALAGLELQDAARQLVAADESGGLLVVDAEAGEHRAERVAGADALFVDELLLVLLQRGDLVRQVRQLQVLGDGFDGRSAASGAIGATAVAPKAHNARAAAPARRCGFCGSFVRGRTRLC
jgi:hypothetical protein